MTGLCATSHRPWCRRCTIAALTAGALIGSCREPAPATSTSAPAAPSASQPASGAAALPSSRTDDPCRGSDIDLRALHQHGVPLDEALAGARRPCEIEVPADQLRLTELAGRFEVAFGPKTPQVAAGEQIVLELGLRNVTAQPQRIDLATFANHAFALEARNAAGKRVDIPSCGRGRAGCSQQVRGLAEERPSFAVASRTVAMIGMKGLFGSSEPASSSGPSSSSAPADPGTPLLRVEVEPGGVASARLTWTASSTELVFKSLHGMPGLGSYRAQPKRPLPPGRYQLRLVTPLLATLRGQAEKVPELTTEIDVIKPAAHKKR